MSNPVQNMEDILEIDVKIASLENKIKDLKNDPKNRGKPGDFYLYNHDTQKKLDKLAMAIANLITEKRVLQGHPITCYGFVVPRKEVVNHE